MAITAQQQARRRPLDIDGAAEYLNTTPRHIRNLAYRRDLPFTKVGRLVRFFPADLDAYLANNRRAAGS